MVAKKINHPAEWMEFHIEPPEGWEEILVSYLFEVGASAIEEKKENGRLILVTHLPCDKKFNDRLAMIGKYFAEISRISGAKGLPKVELTKIKDRPWAKEVRSGFKPVEIVPGIVVLPTWKKIGKLKNKKLLRIDPGEAFGTGLHATTRLCAKLLVEAVSKFDAPSAIDIGTGTGILAMIACASGAGEVYANDIDPKALEVAAENFKLNGFAVKLTAAPVEKISKKFNIVVANILLEELERLAPYIAKITRKGGAIILSGLLTHQADRMIERMAEIGIKGTPNRADEGEWSAVSFIK